MEKEEIIKNINEEQLVEDIDNVLQNKKTNIVKEQVEIIENKCFEELIKATGKKKKDLSSDEVNEIKEISFKMAYDIFGYLLANKLSNKKQG